MSAPTTTCPNCTNGEDGSACATWCPNYRPTPLSRFAAAELVEQAEREALVRRLVDDYDRRRSTRWGRFLLWLLRRTT